MTEKNSSGDEACLVIVDNGGGSGWNCPLSELNKTVVKHGVHLIGIANLPGLVAADASALYARNLMNFLNLMLDPNNGELKINWEDEIIAGTLVCSGGEVMQKKYKTESEELL